MAESCTAIQLSQPPQLRAGSEEFAPTPRRAAHLPWYDPLNSMRSLCFIPLAFLAGNEGFVIFAPYAAAVLLTAHVLRKLRRPALTPPRA